MAIIYSTYRLADRYCMNINYSCISTSHARMLRGYVTWQPQPQRAPFSDRECAWYGSQQTIDSPSTFSSLSGYYVIGLQGYVLHGVLDIYLGVCVILLLGIHTHVQTPALYVICAVILCNQSRPSNTRICRVIHFTLSLRKYWWIDISCMLMLYTCASWSWKMHNKSYFTGRFNNFPRSRDIKNVIKNSVLIQLYICMYMLLLEIGKCLPNYNSRSYWMSPKINQDQKPNLCVAITSRHVDVHPK